MHTLLARLLVAVAVALVPAVALQIYAEHAAHEARARLMQEEARRLVLFISSEQRRIVDAADVALTIFSGAPAVRSGMPDPCRRLAETFQAKEPRYDGFYVFDPDGHRRCGAGSAGGTADMADGGWLRRALTTDTTVASQYQAGPGGEKPVIHLARRFLDRDGNVAGVLALALDVDWFGKQIAAIDLPPGTVVTVADRDGIVVACAPGPPLLLGRPVIEPYLSMRHGTGATIMPVTALDGRLRLATMSKIDDSPAGFLVAVGLDPDLAFPALTQDNRIESGLIAVGGVLVFALTGFVGIRLIGRLQKAAEHWRDGRLGIRTGLPHDRGEFGRLATAFDGMATALAARDQALRGALESTTDSVTVIGRDWRITYMNEQAKARIPAGRGLLDAVLWDVFPEAAETTFGEICRTAMRTGAAGCADTYYTAVDRAWEVQVYPSPDGITIFARDVTEQRRMSAALQRSETLFRAAFEQAAVGMILFSQDETAQQVNDRFCQITGYSREDHIGRPSSFFTHPDDLENDRQFKDGIGSGSLRVVEYNKRYVRRDGGIVWVSIFATPLLEPDGTFDRVLGLIVDITERKRMEAALQDSEERLRLALQAANLGVRDLDLVGGETKWTSEAADILGGAYGPWTTYDEWFARIHLDDQPEVRARWVRALKDPDYAYEAEYRFQQPDGSWRWIAAYGRTLFEGGRAVRSIGVVQNISGRKQVETQLLQTTALLRAVSNSSAAAIYAKDADGRFIYANPAVFGFFGKSADAIIGLTEADCRANPDDAKAAIEADRQVIKSGRTEIVEEVQALADVRPRVFRTAKGPLRLDDGTIAGVVAVSGDITQLKDAEADLRRLGAVLETRVREEVAAREAAQMRAAHAERMQALGQLAGGIAHDFNNVLQAISGAMTLIERRPEDLAGVRRLARLADEATERGAAITRRLLAFGRRGDLREEVIEAGKLLADLREILDHTLGAGIDIQVVVEPGIRPFMADKSQFETSLINLATNARDAMPGGGTLILSAAREMITSAPAPHRAALEPGGYVRFSVADTGSGMDAATLARATEPFFTTKKRGAGTGLGLAMSKGFVQQSGGALAVESSPGQGTVVTLWLPEARKGAKSPGRPAPRNRPAVATPDGAPGAARTRLLVVDDEAPVREILAIHLEDAGFGVLLAKSGTEALALLNEGESIDALVTDLSMPGMDGVALIRAVQDRFNGLPAVLLTGYAGDAATLAIGGAVSGSFSLLRKPVNGQQLIDRLNTLLVNRPGQIASAKAGNS